MWVPEIHPYLVYEPPWCGARLWCVSKIGVCVQFFSTGVNSHTRAQLQARAI